MFVWLKLVFGTYGPAVREILAVVAMVFNYIAPIIRDVQELKRASGGDYDNGVPREKLTEFFVRYDISEERRRYMLDEPLEYPWATLAFEAVISSIPTGTLGVSESMIRCAIEFVYQALKLAKVI